MPIRTEETSGAPTLSGGRDPERRSRSGQSGSSGDVAVKTAVGIVIAAWLLLLFFAYSLRHHNI